MKRTLFVVMALVAVCCLVLPTLGFAKGGGSGDRAIASDRGVDRQEYRQERNTERHMYQHRNKVLEQNQVNMEGTGNPDAAQDGEMKEIQTQTRDQVREPAEHTESDATSVTE